MNNKYNSWCKWHPLKTVMLGRSYYPEYYRDIKNSKIRDCLVRISEETEEDFQNYKKVLEDFGCEVIRPDLDKNENIMDFLEEGKSTLIPRPPAQPRDGQLVMGNTMLYTWYDHPSIKEKLDQYNSDDSIYFVEYCRNKIGNNLSLLVKLPEDKYNELKGSDWPTYEDYLQNNFDKCTDEILAEMSGFSHPEFTHAPCITCVGKDVYVDSEELPTQYIDILHDLFPERRLTQVKIGGHSDGCFHTLKEGVILSLRRYEDYYETFPGWEVCYLPNQSWELVRPFLNLKQKNRGKWWLPGEEDNDEFTDFVETWLQDWVGYCEETVFDVNVLMLDDKHVVVNNYNEQVFDFLKKHNIEPIICPFRHRFFWDGGLHCITLDLYREGEMEDYFPQRG